MATTNKKSVSTNQEKAEIENNQAIFDDASRQLWIEEAAYFMAKARGFAPGFEQEDWNIAEKKYATNV